MDEITRQELIAEVKAEREHLKALAVDPRDPAYLGDMEEDDMPACVHCLMKDCFARCK